MLTENATLRSTTTEELQKHDDDGAIRYSTCEIASNNKVLNDFMSPKNVEESCS